MSPRARKWTGLAIATPLILVAAGLTWIGYQACTVLVADVIGAPVLGCGSKEYAYFTVAAASALAAAAALWIGYRGIGRRTRLARNGKPI